MQAIVVKRSLNTNGNSVYRATCQAGSVRVEGDHGKTEEENAVAAMTVLCARLGWISAFGYGPYACGQLADESYVFVDIGDKQYFVK